MTIKQQSIGVVTPPKGPAASIPLSNLANVLGYLYNYVYVVTAGDIHLDYRAKGELWTTKFTYTYRNNMLSRLFRNLVIQLKVALLLIRIKTQVDTWIFFLDGESLIIPLAVARLIGKTTLILLVASIEGTGSAQKDPFTKLYKYIQGVGLFLSDKIVVYSIRLVQDWDLSKYSNKIIIGHEHFIDTDRFRLYVPFQARDKLIGFIGRLSNEKGVLEFIVAIARLVRNEKDTHALIIGEGPLRKNIEVYVDTNGMRSNIDVIGWINHSELPSYVNKLMLLVLPSHSEGLPNVLLEAMACGTPVLVSHVGAICDFIVDGKTGFILESNSPDYMSRRISELLKQPILLKTVSNNALVLVKSEFKYEDTVNLWKKIMMSI